MGITYAEIGIENLFQKRRMTIKALVDAGSVFLTVPEHIAVQLGFDTSEVDKREVVLADGYVPPSSVREAAGAQSLDQLAPSNPIAAELSQIREAVESLEELIKRQISNGSNHDSQVMMDFIEWMVAHDMVSQDSLIDLLVSNTSSAAHDQWVRRLAKGRIRSHEPRTAVDPWAADEAPF